MPTVDHTPQRITPAFTGASGMPSGLCVSRERAVIVPPAPGLSTLPQSVADMVDFVVTRILDQLHVPNEPTPRLGHARAAAPGGDTEC